MRNLLRWIKVFAYRRLRAVQRAADPSRRARIRERRNDFRRTTAELAGWGRQRVLHEGPDRLFLILSFTDLPVHAKFHGLMAKTMQLRGYTPVMLNVSGNKWAPRYYRLFGVERTMMWDRVIAAREVREPAVRLARELLANCNSVPDLLACTYEGVDVGKHALSMICRRRVQARLDLSDAHVRHEARAQLETAIASVLATARLLDDNPVSKMLVRDPGYIPHGPIYETALRRGIDCIVSEIGQRRGTWILRRSSPKLLRQHFFSLAPETWEVIKREPWTEAHEERLTREFTGRYAPDSTDDTRRLMSGTAEMGPEEIRARLGLDPSKKTAAIFSHIAWDATFFFGECLFDDFESWLYETVRFVATECPQMNWVVKLHPFNAFKLQRETKNEESEMALLRNLMPLPPHVKVMRATSDINTRSLVPVIDYVLTVNGTVGMEFPCFGTPALLAGTGRYDHRGFTIDPSSRADYFARLKSLHEVPRLDHATQVAARKHFYAVMLRRQASLEDVAPMELLRRHEAQSDVHDNISIAVRSLEAFENVPSVKRVGDWMAFDRTPDLLEPDPVQSERELEREVAR